MATIDQIQIPSGTYDIMTKSFYGTCATAAATAAKVVTLSNAVGWNLVPGVVIGVKFTYSNTAASVTLNVNGSGAKSIYYANAVYTGKATQITGLQNYIIYYMYDGTNWVFLNQSGNYIVASNNLVAQTPTTTSANYEVLFSATADNTSRTEGARKNSNLLFNPSTGNLQATQLNGVDIGSSPKFTDTTYTSQAAASGGTAVSLVTTGEKYTWNNKSNLAIGTTATTAAAGNHTHTTSLAADSGTSTVNLASNTTYKLTAGGTSVIFKTPVDNNTTYESKAAASGGTAVSLVTTGEKYTWNNKSNLTIGTTATTAAAGNHTHATSIATSTGTNQLTLAASTKYALTAGGTSYIFTTPPNSDTKNTAGSTDTSSKIFLIGATSQAANPQTYSDNEVYATNGILTTKSVQVGGTAATIQYNSTTKSIDFVFA